MDDVVAPLCYLETRPGDGLLQASLHAGDQAVNTEYNRGVYMLELSVANSKWAVFVYIKRRRALHLRYIVVTRGDSRRAPLNTNLIYKLNI